MIRVTVLMSAPPALPGLFNGPAAERIEKCCLEEVHTETPTSSHTLPHTGSTTSQPSRRCTETPSLPHRSRRRSTFERFS